MRKKFGILIVTVLLLLVAAANAAPGTNAVGAQVHVTSVELNPGVFYPYETGTITVHVTNSGNESATLASATIIDNNFHLVNEHAYDTQIILGPGDVMTYTFVVKADATDGTYFPLFTIAFKDTGILNYPVKAEIDSTDISAGVVKKPDNFALSKKDAVDLSIINPRNNDIKNILIVPEGSGFNISPYQSFISSLSAGSSADVQFSITPSTETNVAFHITYQNGDNKHTTLVVLPLNIGEDKLAAKPIVNNVALTRSGTYYSLTGDVNNAGITDAKSMVITVGAPARAVEPYSEYAIGSLASDDFSSFEITFIASDLSSVPLVISWKDADGNSFSVTKNLDLRASSGSGSSSGSTSANTGSSASSGTATTTSGSSFARSGGGPPGGGSIFTFGGSRGGGISSFYPVIAGGVILIAGIVLYKKRKWIAAKVKKG